jgi:hypothetical protein
LDKDFCFMELRDGLRAIHDIIKDLLAAIRK